MRAFKEVPGQDKAATAASMAKGLHDAWGVGDEQCNNGVLMLLSVGDRQMYISTGAGAVDSLTDDAIDAIIESVRPSLRAGR